MNKLPDIIENKQIHLYLYSTERLDLIAATLKHINAELNEPEQLAKLLNADVNSEWPPGEYDKNAQEYFRDQLLRGGEEIVGWLGWYAVKRSVEKQPAILIASGGYFGAPSESGEVEIGYSVIKSYQGKGYATEIVKALVDIAKKDNRVKRIIARTSNDNIASRNVLEKSGFRYVSIPDSENNILFEKILKV